MIAFLATLALALPLPVAVRGRLAPAPVAIAQGAVAQGAEAPAPTEAGFVDELERIQGLIQRRRWKDVYKRYQALFAEHENAPYVLARIAEIEADLKRCAFWMQHDEPALEDLLAARLEHWDPYRGSVRMVFDRDHLGDLTPHPSPAGVVYELPAVFDSTWSATFEGKAKTLAGDQLYILVNDDLAYVVAFGHRAKGTLVYYKHVLSMREGDRITTLQSAEPAETPDDQNVTARITVTEDRIRVEIARKTVFDLRREDGGGFGRLALSFADSDSTTGDFGTLEVDGRVETGWFDGLIDSAVQEAREAFEASWNTADHMPGWLASAERRDVGLELPELGPFPVPEAFDLAADAHPRTEEHVARVESLLKQGRNADALRYLGEQQPGEIEPTVRAFLGCITLMVSDRPREAFEIGTRLWRDQPTSLTAGYLEAVLNAELKRTDIALERFRKLTDEHPAAWEPWYGLTSLLLLERRVDDAVLVLAAGRQRAAEPAQLLRLEDRLTLLTKGPPWDRVFEESAEHFRIRSDTDARTTRMVANEVEQAWRTYERVLGPVDMPKDAVIPVFLFSGAATYHAYARSALSLDMQHTAGIFSRDLQVVMVWNTPSEEALLATIRHEVLHQYLDARMGELPTWFNEGLAEYYEIAEVERGLPVLGAPHPAHVPFLRALREVPDLRMLTLGSAREFYDSAELAYPMAWAFVHFLRHTTLDRRQRFERLWDGLAAGEDGTTAVDRAFEGVDWDAWNQAFLEHVQTLADGGK